MEKKQGKYFVAVLCFISFEIIQEGMEYNGLYCKFWI
jgi:hypothetical protein